MKTFKYVFSIIVPVYNTEKFLKDCIDSVLKQEFDSFELLCVNDGSTDGSLDILKKYTNDYPEKIKLINQNNVGLSAARNNGIMIAEGEYILFLDSDDLLLDNALTHLEFHINSISADVFAFNSKILFDDKTLIQNDAFNHNESKIYNSGMDYFNSFVKNFGRGPSAVCFYLFKREMLLNKDLKFAKGMLHEDELFMPIVLFYTQKIYVLNDFIYIYRINRDSITHKKQKKNLTDIILISHLLFEFFEFKNIDKKYVYFSTFYLLLFGIQGLIELNIDLKRITIQDRKLLLKMAKSFDEYKLAIMIRFNIRIFKLYINLQKLINKNKVVLISKYK